MKKPMKVIIAGGGTGGHLFPGIALAQELKKQVPSVDILFLCTSQPFDREQLKHYGFNYRILPSPRISVSVQFLVNLLRTSYHSFRILRRFRPGLIIGVGGYGAFGPLVMAKILGIPFILLEQNVLPGKVTRLLSMLAKVVCLQWSASRQYVVNSRLAITGSPLRQEIKRMARVEACRQLGINPDRKILAIIGGSQGAQALNVFCINNKALLSRYQDQLAIIHLTGAHDYARVKDGYETTGLEVYVSPFYHDMSVIYSAADLVLSRSGGIALAEMLCFGLPMVLVPYPYAAENHQYLNALEVQRSGVGIIIRQKNLNPEKMRLIIEDILLKPERLNQMVSRARDMKDVRPEREITNWIRNLLKVSDKIYK